MADHHHVLEARRSGGLRWTRWASAASSCSSFSCQPLSLVSSDPSSPPPLCWLSELGPSQPVGQDHDWWCRCLQRSLWHHRQVTRAERRQQQPMPDLATLGEAQPAPLVFACPQTLPSGGNAFLPLFRIAAVLWCSHSTHGWEDVWGRGGEIGRWNGVGPKDAGEGLLGHCRLAGCGHTALVPRWGQAWLPPAVLGAELHREGVLMEQLPKCSTNSPSPSMAGGS